MVHLLNRLTLAFASAGLAIATALTLAHASNVPLPCGGGNGCDQVAHDPSSSFMGIPVSAFGMGGYLILLAISGALVLGRFETPGRWVGFGVSLFGALVSGWLTYHSVTAIHATCLWCLGSALMMVGSVVTFSMLLRSRPTASIARPITAVPWLVVPGLAIGLIAAFGSRTAHSTGDLLTVDVSQVSFDDIVKTSHLLGNLEAPITIAEFGDLMCPACREMHQRVLRFQSKYPDKVSLLFHHFPLAEEPGHQLSRSAADMSEQLSRSDFWKFVNAVYGSDTQPDKSDLEAIFKSCVEKRIRTPEEAKAFVGKAIDLGKSYGVHQTPTYILFVHKQPIADATSTNLQKVLARKEFADVMHGKG